MSWKESKELQSLVSDEEAAVEARGWCGADTLQRVLSGKKKWTTISIQKWTSITIQKITE